MNTMHFCGEKQETTVWNRELLESVKRGDLEGLKKAFEKGANANVIDLCEDGDPVALHEAVNIKDETTGAECTKILLENGAVTSLRMVSSRNTPLHEAIIKGAEKICHVLVDAGAPLSSQESQNAFGNTPLHVAIRVGNVEIVRLLLEKGADPNVANHRGSTALHMCAFLTSDIESTTSSNVVSSDQNVVISMTADSIDKDSVRQSKQAIIDPYIHIAAILLSTVNISTAIDIQDINGYTPLHIAAQRGCPKLIRLLVDSGASLNIKTNLDEKGRGGRTPYGMATFGYKNDSMQLLSNLIKIGEEKGEGALVTKSLPKKLLSAKMI